MAWSPDLGYAAVDAQVVETAQAAAYRFADLGCTIEEAHPVGEDPWRLIHVLWSTAFAASFRDQFDQIADRLDPGLRAVVEEGFGFRGTDVASAYIERNAYYHQWREFYESYDLLLTPTLPVTAFAAGDDHPGSIAGRATTYLSWTAFTYPVNLTGLPRCQRALRPRRWPARGPADHRRLAAGPHRVCAPPAPSSNTPLGATSARFSDLGEKLNQQLTYFRVPQCRQLGKRAILVVQVTTTIA